MLARRLEAHLDQDLTKKMVILSGPRQCGKTTLARERVRSLGGAYYSWDKHADRLTIQNRDLDHGAKLWAFDELHKYRKWRALLKELADTEGQRPILVTGSAKLELYGRGGDSLQGRYFPHHLHPLTYGEVYGVPFAELDQLALLPNAPPDVDMLPLLELGGFPEPLLSGSARSAARWRLAYAERVVREEVTSLEQVRDIDRMELLYDRLADLAGGVLSINALREDLEVAFDTVQSWVGILERLDTIFRISPFGPPRIKSIKKEQKVYHWDWARCTTPGARLENMVALHLLRAVDWAKDIEGKKLQLRYFRTRTGHEVDFILLRGNKPWIAIEVKTSENDLSPSLRYFSERLKPTLALQVVLNGARERRLENIGATEVRVASVARLLANLP
ncbi:MAG: AAA family ATPase [Polyangiaceae bacterium]|nr:AAA family ATPase [Polyangiaceae bacterium]